MRFSRFLIAGSAIGVVAACTAMPRVDLQAESSAIRELDRGWLAAFTAKDLDAAMSYFAPTAILMPGDSPVIVGEAAIREWFERWLPNPAVSTSFVPEVVEVAASGDLAYDRGVFHSMVETPEGILEVTGKYLIIWRKIGGEWKAMIDISNSDSAEPRLRKREDSDTAKRNR